MSASNTSERAGSQEWEDDEEEMRYVGFFARFWASIFDSILYGYAFFIAINWITTDTDINIGQTIDFADPSAGSWLYDLIVPAILVLGFWIVRQATPGKMIVACKVVNADTGKAPSILQYLLRYLGYFVSIITLGLGFLWIIFDSRKQGFHDKIANTVVVKARW